MKNGTETNPTAKAKLLIAALLFALALTLLSCGQHGWNEVSGDQSSNSGDGSSSSMANNTGGADGDPLLRQTVRVDYSIRNSADYYGDRYLVKWSPDYQHPSVSTFVNEDGTITVCVSDDNAKLAYIYEFSMNLEEQKRFVFPYEFDMFGAFTKDSEGNYYFFYAKEATRDMYATDAENEPENMAMVKYSKSGNKIKTWKSKPRPPGSGDGVVVPFRTGCRLEISGSMLAVHFARAMFKQADGSAHQAAYKFLLNKDTFESADNSMTFPLVSHSFNQFILPINNGFAFADQGDSYPQRAFNFAKYTREQGNSRIPVLSAFSFLGEKGDNTTNAQMGGLAKTSVGYIFSGSYGETPNKRNIFTLTFDESFTSISNPAYLAEAAGDVSVGNPKIVGIGSRQYLLLWELYKFTSPAANRQLSHYLSTKAQIVNEAGNPLSPVKDLEWLRLSMNDVLRYNPRNGRVYWAINDISGSSFTVYALDARYAYASANIDLEPPFRLTDGYGLALTEFSPEKTSVQKNEQFTVSVNLRNMSEEQFPGESQYGVALINGSGEIVEIIGSKRMIGAINSGSGWSNPSTATCKVLDSVPSGQYKLSVVIKPNGKDEWKVATMSFNDTPTAIDFTVR